MVRLVRLTVLALLVLLGLATESNAAVRLDPVEAPAGSVADLHFLVTNDRPDVFTKKVQVVFPVSPEFETAQASAPSGWSSSVDARIGRVTSVTYESGSVRAGETADFIATVTVPFEADRAFFRVLQTYSDGQVRQWTADPTVAPDDPDAGVALRILGGRAVTTTVPPVTTTTPAVVASDGEGFSLGTGQVFIALGIGVFIAVMMRAKRLRRRTEK